MKERPPTGFGAAGRATECIEHFAGDLPDTVQPPVLRFVRALARWRAREDVRRRLMEQLEADRDEKRRS